MAETEPATDKTVRFWLNQLEASKKWSNTWIERGNKVEKRYIDERNTVSTELRSGAHNMNTLWSNVQTTLPALYARTPNPRVTRRHKDRDPIGRWAAMVLERALGYTLEAHDFDYEIRSSVVDYLLPGRGQTWVSYNHTLGAKEVDGKQAETLEWEACKSEHLDWRDFRTNPARRWDEVWWVAKREWLNREQLVERFKDVGKKIPLTADKPNDERDNDDIPVETDARTKKALIWEIWDKSKGKIIFVAPAYTEKAIEERDPPYKLDGFFPCPRPLTTTTLTNSLIPVPDFYLYQDQSNEIDRITAKIDELTKALKVRGVYDASIEELSDLLSNAFENDMIPVKNWATFAANAGLKGSVDFLPIDPIVSALRELYQDRAEAKQAMYEVTGIADIVRGATNPNETLGAQQLKSQWGTLRIRDRQKEVQRFIRDIIRIKAEIIAETFSFETLRAMANVILLTEEEKQQLAQRKQAIAQAQAQAQAAQQQGQPPQQLPQIPPLTQDQEKALTEPSWDEVLALLKSDKLRGFSIDIETDSTIQPDEQEEKTKRTEFVKAVTDFFIGVGPIIQQAPTLTPMFSEFLLFAVRGFGGAEALEGVIEEVMDEATEQAKQLAQNPPPDPEAQKAQAEQQKDQQAAQAEQQKQNFARESHQLDMQAKAEDREFEREKWAHELNKMREDVSGKAEIAKASRPTGEELAPAMGPLVEIMQQMAESIVKANEQSQSMVNTAVQQMIQLAAAPREITVDRDPATGRISSGKSVPKPTVQ